MDNETVSDIVSEIRHHARFHGSMEPSDLLKICERIENAEKSKRKPMPNETVADIVEEMRNSVRVITQSAWYSLEDWRQLCDRIEAADNRLRAALRPVMECDLTEDDRNLDCTLMRFHKAIRESQEIMKGENNDQR